MRRTAAVIGTAIFFVLAPCVVVGVVPWWISRWEFRLSFLGVELTRFVGAGPRWIPRLTEWRGDR
jgi:hypothetical protein